MSTEDMIRNIEMPIKYRQHKGEVIDLSPKIAEFLQSTRMRKLKIMIWIVHSKTSEKCTKAYLILVLTAITELDHLDELHLGIK